MNKNEIVETERPVDDANSECRFVYAGVPGPGHGSWRFIKDTVEDRQKAIQEGCCAFSTMSFATEPAGKKQPTRYGDLWLDIDCKDSPALAVLASRAFVDGLASLYELNPKSLRYYMSGAKGVHIRIPAKLFGGEDGHPYLPMIHFKMIQRIVKELDVPTEGFE